MANSKIGRILAIATTVCAILTAILFIVCCAHLYFTGGDTPYSRERVGEYLLVTAAPSIITILLVIGGFIYSAVSGKGKDETTPRTKIEQLEGFSKRYDLSSFDEKTKDEILRQRKNREIFKYVARSFSAAVFVLVLVYMCFFARFTAESINKDIITALAFALPMSALGLGIHVPRLYVAESSASKELDLMKAYIKENNVTRAEAGDVAVQKKVDYAVIVRCVLILASVAFIILGITNGGMKSTLGKAVQICLECIGIG